MKIVTIVRSVLSKFTEFWTAHGSAQDWQENALMNCSFDLQPGKELFQSADLQDQPYSSSFPAFIEEVSSQIERELNSSTRLSGGHVTSGHGCRNEQQFALIDLLKLLKRSTCM